MTGTALSIVHRGLSSELVDVEAHISRHLPSFILVGLPDAAVQEARERIRSALENSGFQFPRTKVTVNLAPAHIRKEGSGYDLAIAVAIIRAHTDVSQNEMNHRALFLGELALDGSLRAVSGVLLTAASLSRHGIRILYVPSANAREASCIEGVTVYGVSSLSQLIGHLNGTSVLQPEQQRGMPPVSASIVANDFADVRGQEFAKRALEIAAAGGHNILMSGVPGSGKTMLARSFPSLLPTLSQDEVLEVSKIYSYAGLLSEARPFILERPFRSPHHTASVASIVGGGTWPRPGEITLAHRGVLFLDEFPEFPRSVLEALRQPLEEHTVSITRVSGSTVFPAHFILLAAQNPCPCGHLGDTEQRCICSEQQRVQYRRRLSGPLLDRIDLHVRVAPVKRNRLLSEESVEPSSTIAARIQQARRLQRHRYDATRLNGELDVKLVKRYCAMDEKLRNLLVEAAERLHLSARALYKTIKVSRTIADIAGREVIGEDDVLEALQYRATVDR